MAEEDYKKFSASLNPGVENVLGIRVPLLRKFAKEVAAEIEAAGGVGGAAGAGDAAGDAASGAAAGGTGAVYSRYLAENDFVYMEERMLRGMVIGCIKIADAREYLSLVSTFVPIINSWSVCDTFDFYGKQRFVDKNKELVWEYLEQWVRSDKEYEIRFGVVQTMMHFIDSEYIDKVLARLISIQYDAYYVKMAIAWALSVCYVKFPEKTLSLLQNNAIPEWTHNKTIQKICESLRVTKEDKEMVRKITNN